MSRTVCTISDKLLRNIQVGNYAPMMHRQNMTMNVVPKLKGTNVSIVSASFGLICLKIGVVIIVP